MKTWMRMTNDAITEAESIRPRFLDFKVYADGAHHAAGIAANLLPVSNSVSGAVGTVGSYTATPGEWEASKIYVPIARDTSPAAGLNQLIDLELIAVGPSYPGAGASGLDAVSLVEGYAASRGLPEIRDPNAPTDAADTVGSAPQNWMTAIFNEGETQSHEIIEDLLVENNQSPYPFENDGVHVDTMYPGGANQLQGLQVHDFEKITGSTIGGTTYLRGGSFPCGLLKIVMLNYSLEHVIQPVLQINIMPGNHRGLLCAPMSEM